MSDTKPTPTPRPKRTTVDPELNPRFSNVPVETEQPGSGERVLAVGWEVLKTVAFIVLVAVFIRAFVVQPFFVEGQSMEPDFHDGDYLLVNQLSFRLGKPDRGDVIVFKAPPAPDENYIKRVIGLPGETVELTDGGYTIKNDQHPNGVRLEEPYIEPGVRTLTDPESNQTRWELGPDQYFVSGDNRNPGKSSDSRAWGPVPTGNIIGKTALRVYPLADLGLVQHQSFPELSSGTLLLTAFSAVR